MLKQTYIKQIIQTNHSIKSIMKENEKDSKKEEDNGGIIMPIISLAIAAYLIYLGVKLMFA